MIIAILLITIIAHLRTHFTSLPMCLIIKSNKLEIDIENKYKHPNYSHGGQLGETENKTSE